MTNPIDIEKQSFTIISRELYQLNIPEPMLSIVTRVIHTTADFDFARLLSFTPDAITSALSAIKNHASIITDTTMALAGINKKSLSKLGLNAHCFIGDDDVANKAKSHNLTRSAIAMEKAMKLPGPLIFAIGNAPTALLSVSSNAKIEKTALVIGAPVGFVNVLESKEALLASSLPSICVQSRKGGSPVAAAIVNALMLLALNN